MFLVAHLQVTNDISGMDLPLLQLTVEDTRASVLSFHVGGRLLASAGASVAAEFYNPQRALWGEFPCLSRSPRTSKCMLPKHHLAAE